MRVLFTVILFSSQATFADQWSFPATIESQTFDIGDLVIERIVDSRENQLYPLFEVRVSRDESELARYRNLTFSHLQLFGDGKLIFAGTNSGLSRFAYFILDKDGGLVSTHAHSEDIPYCDYSVTLIRRWLPDEVQIEEEYKEVAAGSEAFKYLNGAHVMTCGGERFQVFR